ncbi:hypothetical protein [Prauserella marina]|uniref:hypothetical protein n=1 Tax=Prauserella marina TaxID=530584 RepID=UPI0014754C7F|nr:hypothetical protein [Prauserella marina]
MPSSSGGVIGAVASSIDLFSLCGAAVPRQPARPRCVVGKTPPGHCGAGEYGMREAGG